MLIKFRFATKRINKLFRCNHVHIFKATNLHVFNSPPRQSTRVQNSSGKSKFRPDPINRVCHVFIASFLPARPCRAGRTTLVLVILAPSAVFCQVRSDTSILHYCFHYYSPKASPVCTLVLPARFFRQTNHLRLVGIIAILCHDLFLGSEHGLTFRLPTRQFGLI